MPSQMSISNTGIFDVTIGTQSGSPTVVVPAPPPVVTAGLQVYLDAGNVTSYGGSGTTWYDISGNSRNATLVNTPTYDSVTNGGLFSFDDASFEYATIPDIGTLSVFTVEAWCRIHKSLTGKVTMVVGNQFNGTSDLNYSIGTNRAAASYNMTFGLFDGAWYNVNGFAASLNVWYHLVGTYDGSTLKFYNNGTLDTQLSRSGGSPASGGEIRIARRWDDVANSSTNFFDGDISIIRIYNAALTAAQVGQNYEAQKSRYGL